MTVRGFNSWLNLGPEEAIWLDTRRGWLRGECPLSAGGSSLRLFFREGGAASRCRLKEIDCDASNSPLVRFWCGRPGPLYDGRVDASGPLWEIESTKGSERWSTSTAREGRGVL